VNLQDVIDVLAKIAAIITSISVIGVFFLAVTKKGKSLVANWCSNIFKIMLEKELDPIRKATKCVLRSDIEDMCESCRINGFITTKEYEDITEANDAYIGLRGNGYTYGIVKHALSLPIKG
jgi:hypothetical protein